MIEGDIRSSHTAERVRPRTGVAHAAGTFTRFFYRVGDRRCMARETAVGGGLTIAGIVGYVVGIFVAYPGRAFSLTAIMAGLALLAVARQPSTEDEA